MNQELQDVQAGFGKGRGSKDQIANICWIIDKASALKKEKIYCFIDCVDHKKLENSSRDGNTRPPYLPPEKPPCRTRKQNGRGTIDRFQIGKGVFQGCIVSPRLFNLCTYCM